MTTPSDYVTGTITLTNGLDTFTGTGTGWIGFKEGDTIIDLPGTSYQGVIAEITSPTAGRLTKDWEGPTQTTTYRMRFQPDGSTVAAQARNLIELLGNGNLLSLASVTGPGVLVMDGAHSVVIEPRVNFINGVRYDKKVDTLVDRAAYNGQVTGYTVLVSNIGDGRAALYAKASDTSGDWDDPAIITGVPPLPVVTIDDVTTGPPGSAVVVTATPTFDGFELDFTIPEGEGFAFIPGGWLDTTTYNKGDVATRFGSSWISIQNTNLDHEPPTLPTTANAWWELLAIKGNDGAGTVAGVIAGNGISVNNTDPTNPIISTDIAQSLQFYTSLALEQAEDRASGPVVAGPAGNGLFDGFNVTTYVDLANSSNILTSETGVIKPSVVAAETLAALTLTNNFANNPGYNMRIRIAASQLSKSGGRMRIKFRGVTSGTTLSVATVYIGHKAASGDAWDMDGTQVAVTLGGNAAFTLPAGTFEWSDWINYAVDETRDLIVSFYTVSGDIRAKSGSSANFDWWLKEAANETGSSNVSGYTESGSYEVAMVEAIEIEEPANMTALGATSVLSAVPDWVILTAFVLPSNSVLNTNLVFSVSRNGVNYLTLTMTELYTRLGGSKVYSSGKVSLASLASGTNGKWKIATTGNVGPKVQAVGIVFGVN